MIHVEHLTRRFGATNAIEDLTFHLDAGEMVGFLGPNGAGKTTTMRILAGYLPATSGRVEIAGLDVLRDSLAVRRRIGYLPEAVPLYREHRVREMLEFQARLHRMPRRAYRTQIPAVLERVRIADRENSLIGSLSRGQRQRVGLAVALLPNPKVLILDEPTSGLDPLQRLEMRVLLRELAKEHTVLLSSHILPEIEAVCRRVIILNFGKIVADGTPEQLVRDQARASSVRLEALVGPDPEPALKLLRGIRGVTSVEDRGRLGIHHCFQIYCTEDLREDVGAIAARRGWAIRELSWTRPTLESLFAHYAIGLDTVIPSAASEPAGDKHTVAAPGLVEIEAPAGKPLPLALGTPTPPRPAYNLNPFEGAVARDLSKPKPVLPPPATPLDPRGDTPGAP